MQSNVMNHNNNTEFMCRINRCWPRMLHNWILANDARNEMYAKPNKWRERAETTNKQKTNNTKPGTHSDNLLALLVLQIFCKRFSNIFLVSHGMRLNWTFFYGILCLSLTHCINARNQSFGFDKVRKIEANAQIKHFKHIFANDYAD